MAWKVELLKQHEEGNVRGTRFKKELILFTV